ncbi:putative membrane protein [Bacteroides fragilis str. 3986 N(B)22]|nr:putative membrane protein [Bacteroides fragilis str. DS-208]EYA24322.1 putative membrane protein [Bacteroides fragilis str. 1007-1-F \
MFGITNKIFLFFIALLFIFCFVPQKRIVFKVSIVCIFALCTPICSGCSFSYS